MIPANNPFRKLVLVCQREREGDMDCCMKRGSENLYHELKMAAAAEYTDVRVIKSSCLGNCLTGVTVIVMPNNEWLGEVSVNDIPEIIEKLK